MPAITQSKVTPILVVAALAIVGYVLYGKFMNSSPTPAAAAPTMASVPRADGSEPVTAKTGGLLGLGALSASAPQRRADADTPGETLKTVTASNNELRTQVQQVIEANQSLLRENATLRADQAMVVSKTKEQVLVELKAQNPSGMAIPAADGSSSAASSVQKPNASSGLGDIVTSASDGVGKMVDSLSNGSGTSQAGIPRGLGYDGAGSGSSMTAMAPATTTPNYSRLLPMGFKEATGDGGKVGIVRTNGMPISQQGMTPSTSSGSSSSRTAAPADSADAEESTKKPPRTSKPYFTIPENATLTRGTMMTALVGRVPIDGRVQDPMPFKLLIGRDNLAANGKYVPDDIAGVVVSGIAIGDMALSCVEGHVQSLTFVFEDDTLQTVSLKKNGGIAAGGGSGGGGSSGGQASLSPTNKLGWLSDEFGNPCISGKFVTNAPAYLTDVVGLKTLSIAAQASSLAQTTTTAGPLGSTSSVTGNKGTFVLGQAASSGVDEVSSWITRRLNNSFDAVIARADTRVVLHVEQDIAIDKGADARKLDYARHAGTGRASRRTFD